MSKLDAIQKPASFRPSLEDDPIPARRPVQEPQPVSVPIQPTRMPKVTANMLEQVRHSLARREEKEGRNRRRHILLPYSLDERITKAAKASGLPSVNEYINRILDAIVPK